MNSILDEKIENEENSILGEELAEKREVVEPTKNDMEVVDKDYKPTRKTKFKNTTLFIAKVSALSSIAVLLMFLQFPIFPAFSFLKIDFSNIPALIGGFVLNPLAGFAIECVKVLVNTLIEGTMTGYIGELSNLIVSLAFVLPPTIIYYYRKTFLTAILSLVVGVVIGTTVACLSNYFLVFPLYLNGFGMGILQGKTLANVIFTIVLPFNLIKQSLNALLTIVLYKKTAKILRRF